MAYDEKLAGRIRKVVQAEGGFQREALDVLVDGDRVVVRGTDRGTQRGDFMGFPASG